MSDDNEKALPRIHGVKPVCNSRLFHVEQVQLEFSNGQQCSYERVHSGGGAVLIVAMPDDDHVFLVREYAVGTERYELGFPKGRMEPDESPVHAARRELAEEVGFSARRLDYLQSLTVAPGYFSHLTHLVLARDLYPDTAEGDEPEPLEVVKWRLSELPELLEREDFSEARSIAALFLVRQYLEKQN
ncbi:MAG: ADP compounds hydrolase NudE [Gammaproteobacteria bacterium]|nr:ADP compounds hydrolase NudE [Gammaproteobacteria bacterium]